jgi:hypothetical protein
MLRLGAALALAGAVALPVAAGGAPTERTFQVTTTRDLIDLCAVEASHPLGTAAANFCVGFVVGAYAVLKEMEDAEGPRRMFCPPEPPPSRPQAIAAFQQWAQQHPADLALPPADGFYRFLAQHYPCAAKR